MTEAKFKVGDLILLTEEAQSWSDNDYGIIFKVEDAGNGLYGGDDIYYHIYWAIDQTDTIEGDLWTHSHAELIARA